MAPEEFKFFDKRLKLASICIGIGNKELGYKHLEDFFNKDKTHKIRYIYHEYIDLDKNFEKVRDEERFKNIINTKGGTRKS